MFALILSLIALGLFAAFAGILRRQWYARHTRDGEPASPPPVRESRPAGCCGQHEICEKESLLAAVSKDIEYYDDEELDRFSGRPSSSYTADEVEEFEEVLTTMRTDEVAGWVRSLQLRGVLLPDELKDEVIMLVGERRMGAPVQ